MSKRFTVQEAEQILSEIEEKIRRAISLKSEYREAESQLHAVSRHIMEAGGVVVNREEVLGLKVRRETTAAQLKEAVDAIQRYGCLVKDLDIGLIDFPTLFRGQEVLLCWKLGESRIEFWHGVEEGFAGRKRIDREFLNNHKGDSPEA
jgi:hypothetical protein